MPKPRHPAKHRRRAMAICDKRQASTQCRDHFRTPKRSSAKSIEVEVLPKVFGLTSFLMLALLGEMEYLLSKRESSLLRAQTARTLT